MERGFTLFIYALRVRDVKASRKDDKYVYVAFYPVNIRVLIKTNCDLEDVFSYDDRLVG